MNGNRVYIVLATFFLFLMVGIKGLSYHSLSHDEGDGAVQCELCSFVMQQETLDYHPPADPELQLPHIPAIDREKDLEGTVVVRGRYSPDALFSRPPPAWA